MKNNDYLMDTYSPYDINIVKGEGSYLFDKENNKYLDMISGIGVNALGYGDKKVKEISKDILDKYIHLSNLFRSEEAEELSKKLCKETNFEKVFFCNSGTEANEAAFKLARLYGMQKSKDKRVILSASNGFHGRSLGSLSATYLNDLNAFCGVSKKETNCFIYNDIDDFNSKLNENICAVVVEVVQGSGGLNIISEDFYNNLFKKSKEFEYLIIVDEVQTGVGRTGKLFAHQKFNQKPHIITTAKALGGGFPLGAMIANKDICKLFKKGIHGSTFGGNPVACATGLYTLSKISNMEFLSEVNRKGEFLKKELNKILKKYPLKVKQIRGLGLMQGIVLEESIVADVKEGFLKSKILVNFVRGNILRLLPPLNMEIEELKIFLKEFENILKK